jgi:hypothetical protein
MRMRGRPGGRPLRRRSTRRHRGCGRTSPPIRPIPRAGNGARWRTDIRPPPAQTAPGPFPHPPRRRRAVGAGLRPAPQGAASASSFAGAGREPAPGSAASASSSVGAGSKMYRAKTIWQSCSARRPGSPGPEGPGYEVQAPWKLPRHRPVRAFHLEASGFTCWRAGRAARSAHCAGTTPPFRSADGPTTLFCVTRPAAVTLNLIRMERTDVRSYELALQPYGDLEISSNRACVFRAIASWPSLRKPSRERARTSRPSSR